MGRDEKWVLRAQDFCIVELEKMWVRGMGAGREDLNKGAIEEITTRGNEIHVEDRRKRPKKEGRG